MGVISLLGEKQAKYISDLLAERLEETERAERRIICGDAYAFQGDERDVIFLSLVVADNAHFAPLVKDSDRQRFNVATSRARDQVFLFHSVKLDSIRNPECVRYRLLEWYGNPPAAEMEYGIEILKQKAESDFEIDVGERLIKRGYKLIPQFKPLPNDFNYRIDLVVEGAKKLVGIECDGDKYHGPERWEYDQRREAQLRRAGWKFWRISGSAFYRDKEGAMEGLWKFLENEGIGRQRFSDGTQEEETKNPSQHEETRQKASNGPRSQEESRDRDSEAKEGHQSSRKAGETNAKGETGGETKQDTTNKYKNRADDLKEKLDLFSNWETWKELISWGERTGRINSRSRATCYQIVDKLKLGRKISPWLKQEMESIWKIAIWGGFKPGVN